MMFAIAEFKIEPKTIDYVLLPNNFCDVWLRKNIESYTDDEGNKGFKADEAYARIVVNKNDIENNFDQWFEIVKSWKPSQPTKEKTLLDRVAELEELFLMNSLKGE